MIVKATCGSCDQPFTWHRDYASRRVVRHTCRACLFLESGTQRDILRISNGTLDRAESRFGRRLPDGTRERPAFFDQNKPLDGRETIRISGVRLGCLGCGLPYSTCTCKRSNP